MANVPFVIVTSGIIRVERTRIALLTDKHGSKQSQTLNKAPAGMLKNTLANASFSGAFSKQTYFTIVTIIYDKQNLIIR